MSTLWLFLIHLYILIRHIFHFFLLIYYFECNHILKTKELLDM